jgi:hypothetical protein
VGTLSCSVSFCIRSIPNTGLIALHLQRGDPEWIQHPFFLLVPLVFTDCFPNSNEPECKQLFFTSANQNNVEDIKFDMCVVVRSKFVGITKSVRSAMEPATS